MSKTDDEMDNDRSRPWHLSPSGAGYMDGWWNKVPMVPLHLKFDDGNCVGERVCAWVRPEDVWRFTDAEPFEIPQVVLDYVKDTIGEGTAR